MSRTTLVPFLLIAAIGLLEARPWTNTQGKVIEAEMVGSDENQVSLKLANGKVVPVPLASLSPVDQEYVRVQPKGPIPATKAGPGEGRKWPDVVEVPNSELDKTTAVKEDGGGFVYQSVSFEYRSPDRLSASLIKEVARTFEATKRLVGAIPWGIECRPADGRDRYLAALYRTMDDYHKAGGPRNSGGVYMSKDKTFHIPFESLGLKKLGQGYTKDETYTNETLVHEITHQMMDAYLPFLPKWAVEGSAEFAQMMPYKAGKFRIVDHPKAIKEYVARYREEERRIRGLKADDKSTEKQPTLLPNLKNYLRMTRSSWDGPSTRISSPFGDSRQFQLYHQSGMMVYYFNFLDGDAPNQGQRWMKFMDATLAEAGKWETYQREFDLFLKKQDEFFALPGVKKLEDGRYSFPSNLTPPLPPDSPDGAKKLTPKKRH
jgi:hypothetical protein